MLTSRSTPCAARSATGSRGYSRRGQNVGSFHASSHTVTSQAMSLEDQRGDACARLEVAVFVEHVVRRQQRLAVPAHHLAAMAQHGGVEQRLAARRRRWARRSRRRCRAGRWTEPRRDRAGRDWPRRTRTAQQIARRVPRRRQFGQQQQIGAVRGGPGGSGRHLAVVLVEGPDGEIQLSERDAHRVNCLRCQCFGCFGCFGARCVVRRVLRVPRCAV